MRMSIGALFVVSLFAAAGPSTAGWIGMVDFEDGTFGPFFYRDTGWSVSAGAARCSIQGSGTLSQAITDLDVLDVDFVVSYRMRSDVGANHIMNFLMQETGDHYHLNYRTTPFDDIRLYWVAGGNSTLLANADVPPAFNLQWFDIEVQAQGQSFTAAIDGELALTFDSWAPPYTTGGLAMACFVGGSAAEASVAYDFVAVTDTSIPRLAVSPRHGRIVLDWVNPVGVEIVATEIYRAVVATPDGASAYPLYERHPDAVVPVNPSSRQDAVDSPLWELVNTVPAHVVYYEDVLVTRGRYHYVLFTELAGEQYTSAMIAENAGTNYLIGDVAAEDGAVDWFDLGRFVNLFATGDGDPLFEPIADIAPNSSGYVDGFPIPDGRIDFEDLMLATTGFGAIYAYEPRPAIDGPLVADVRLTQFSDTEVLCEVIDPGPGFIGLHLTGPVPLGDVDCREGPLAQQLAGVGFHGLDDVFPFDVTYALIGEDAVVDQPGTLFYLDFAAPMEIGSVNIEVRGIANTSLVNEGYATAVGSTPLVAPGVRVHPNPFNPSTVIEYDLYRAATVQVRIHDARGMLVRELVRGPIAAGRCSWRWDGTDQRGSAVASGVYFCRITTPHETAVGKLLLAR